MPSESERLERAIETARADVAKARYAYSRGGSLERLQAADARLVDAHADFERHRALRVDCGRIK